MTRRRATTKEDGSTRREVQLEVQVHAREFEWEDV